jgi:Fe-S cluster assembly protein SufD
MSLVADTSRPVDAATAAGKAHTDSAAAFVPDKSRAERTASFEPADFPVPTGREEEWRFSPVKLFRDLLELGPTGEITWETELPEGVTVSTISPAEARELDLPAPQDRAAVVAAASAPKVTLVDIADEAELSGPVRLHLAGQDGTARSHEHVVIRAGHHSHATVLLAHSGSARHSQLVSILGGDSSNLTVVSAQRWENDAVHLAQHDALVGRDATYRHIAITLGGQVVRLNANVRYSGTGGDATLLGVYFADPGQHLEHRSFVDHNTGHCASHVTYKGALQGETARTVWVGDALIRAEAVGTDTYELNRNLILTDGARADSVPNLEIETGEIKGAGHASATARFDDEQLFYLQARGIPEDEAKRLVVRGFFADVVRTIPIADLREEISEAIEQELAATIYAAAPATSSTTDSTTTDSTNKEN